MTFRQKGAISWKKTKTGYSRFFTLFVRFWPDYALKQLKYKGETSTTRSDEECLDLGPTLSYPIVQLDPYGPGYSDLAMNPRLNGLRLA